MKYIKLLLLLFIAISCRGQEKKGLSHKETLNSGVLNDFEKQKHRFEIKGYKLFYNDWLLKSDSLKSVISILGRPKYINEIYYTDKPLNLDYKSVAKVDKEGHTLFINRKDKKTYILTEESREEYDKFGDAIMIFDKQGDTLKIIRKYRIHFQQYKARYIADKRDSMLMQIPPVEGSIKVNGFLIDKNTTMDELKQKLKPTIKNADFFVLGGDTVSTWYYGTENDEPLIMIFWNKK